MEKDARNSLTVCMLIWDYWPGRQGGAQRQCQKISHALSRRGIKIMVVTQRTSWWSRKTVFDQEIPIVRLGFLAPMASMAIWIHKWKTRWSEIPRFNDRLTGRPRRKWGITIPIWWLARVSFMLAAKKYIGRNHRGMDLIHVHESNWIAGFASWLGTKTSLPVLCKAATLPCLTPMGPDVPCRKKLLTLRPRIHFIALNTTMAAELNAANIRTDRIHLIPNGVEIPARQAFPQKNGNVIFVANFTQGAHLKAYDILFEAWSLVHRQAPTARLTLVGGGDFRPWQKLAFALDCGNSVSFKGFVSKPDDLYHQAAVLVLPSRTEGMSNALLEAQSRGIPAVVSAIPGNLAVVTDEYNGLVVGVNDAPALAQALLRLLADPELRAKLGEQARQKTIKEFSIGVVSTMIADLYLQIITQKKAFVSNH